MKIWTGYGTEHSANLVIIGNFKTVDDATIAKEMIDELTEIVQNDYSDGLIAPETPYTKTSDRMMEFGRRTNFFAGYAAPEGLLYDYNMEQHGKQIKIHTEDDCYLLLLNVMIRKGAKIEIFSAHDYKCEYSRN